MEKINDINYEFDKIVELIKVFEEFIKKTYKFEQFQLYLAVETSYNGNVFLRICLQNDISHKRHTSNGLIKLVHKLYEFENENIDNQINDCVIKFFSIQKDLKDLDLDFIISDNRKSE